MTGARSATAPAPSTPACPRPRQGEPLLPGPDVRRPVYHAAGDPHTAPFAYGRDRNRTWRATRPALGELEGGEAVVFASGMAAVTAVLLRSSARATCWLRRTTATRRCARSPRAPDRPRGGGPARADARATRSSTRSTARRSSGSRARRTRASTSPTCARSSSAPTPPGRGSPSTTRSPRRSASARSSSAPTSRWRATRSTSPATPTSCWATSPSATPAIAEQLREWRTHTGSIPGRSRPGSRTGRSRRSTCGSSAQCANALALAEPARRARRRERRALPRPARPTRRTRSRARQMSRFGTVLAFDLGSEGSAAAFLPRSELIAEATSFGGVHSTAERRARWGRDAVPQGFIRLSAGLEDAADLIADVDAALGSGPRARRASAPAARPAHRLGSPHARLGHLGDRRGRARRGRGARLVHVHPRPDRDRRPRAGDRRRRRARRSRSSSRRSSSPRSPRSRSCGRSPGATCTPRRRSAPGRRRWSGQRALVLERVDGDSGQVKIGGEVWTRANLRRGRRLRAGRARRRHEDRGRHGARRGIEGELRWLA